MADKNPNIVEIDIRGQICPSALLTTLREVNERKDQIKDGQLEILVKTDNRDSITTIPHSVSTMGYRVSVSKKKGYYLISIGSVCRERAYES